MFLSRQINMFLKTWILLSSVLVTSGHAGILNDVNDVSYMWPPVVGAPSDAAKLIGLSQIVPEAVFEEIVSFSKGGALQGQRLPNRIDLPNEVANIANWRLVAMRIDPCAPEHFTNRAAPYTCLQEMRLVVQPFSYDGVWEYHDYALHILFQISEGTPATSWAFKDLVDQLSRLKIENEKFGIYTNGIPLKIHPGFKRTDFRNQLQKIVLDGIKKYRLTKITFSGAETEIGPWVFFQGLVDNQKFILERDPTLRNLPFTEAIPEMPGKGGTIVPLPTNQNWLISETGDRGLAPSIFELFYTGTLDLNAPATLPDGTPSTVFKLSDLVHALENPNITNRTNTDCISCHTSMSRGLLMNLSDNENTFKYKSPNPKLTIKADYLTNSPTNFRLFGWFGSRPVISSRVINESAEAAAIIEKNF